MRLVQRQLAALKSPVAGIHQSSAWAASNACGAYALNISKLRGLLGARRTPRRAWRRQLGPIFNNALVSSVQLGLTAAQVLALPFYHPVIEEALLAPLCEIDKRAS